MAKFVRSKKNAVARISCTGVLLLTGFAADARNVYLNGIDISNAQGQNLKNVEIRIDERGDIFIIAPHYQVHEEDVYLPLSSAQASGQRPQQRSGTPEHQKPRELKMGTGDALQSADEIDGVTPPAGEPSEPAMIPHEESQPQTARSDGRPSNAKTSGQPVAATLIANPGAETEPQGSGESAKPSK